MTRIECESVKVCAGLAQAQQEIVVAGVEVALAVGVLMSIYLARKRWWCRP